MTLIVLVNLNDWMPCSQSTRLVDPRLFAEEVNEAEMLIPAALCNTQLMLQMVSGWTEGDTTTRSLREKSRGCLSHPLLALITPFEFFRSRTVDVAFLRNEFFSGCQSQIQ